ncbi:MAG: hypothetical protein GWN61_10815, partial [candidate division Zixibacteria bacterium]|nr:hypothetical protein [candidate division Zixibacteria bacterium]
KFNVSMIRYSIITFLLVLLTGALFFLLSQENSTPYSYQNQLDINNASFEEIAKLPIPNEVAEKVYYRIQYQGWFDSFYELGDIEGMTQEMLLKIKPLVRI